MDDDRTDHLDEADGALAAAVGEMNLALNEFDEGELGDGTSPLSPAVARELEALTRRLRAVMGDWADE